jgi:hypothetical protein
MAHWPPAARDPWHGHPCPCLFVSRASRLRPCLPILRRARRGAIAPRCGATAAGPCSRAECPCHAQLTATFPGNVPAQRDATKLFRNGRPEFFWLTHLKLMRMGGCRTKSAAPPLHAWRRRRLFQQSRKFTIASSAGTYRIPERAIAPAKVKSIWLIQRTHRKANR